MRSNSVSSHGSYMVSNSSMQGSYLMHSAKGSEWKKPHKYIDKRWIHGAWHYLYEIPKEFAEKAGETIAEKYQADYKAQHSELEKLSTDLKKREKMLEDKIKNGEDASKVELQQTKNAIRMCEERISELDDIEKKRQSAFKATNERYAKDVLDVQKRKGAYLDKAKEDTDKLSEAKRREEEALDEKDSAIYKASKALNKIDDMIDDASGSAKQGLQWLKNQLESSNKWAMNTLAAIEKKGTSAVTTGNAFLQNLLGGNNRSIPTFSSSSSGRNYSGIGNKAQRRETVAGWPVSDNDYRRRPKR